jgi:hypothetical protein
MEREASGGTGILRLPPSHEDYPELRPSTPGGLVIPPFPPLDPARRRARGAAAVANGGRTNPANPFDAEWDDELIIGGHKLPGYLDAEEGKREVDRVVRQLESLDFAPFTVQRLAELLIAPTRRHSTLGKFLRAVDKMLSVTTAYAPPSYTYEPPLPGLDGYSRESMSPGGSRPDGVATVRPDLNSTLPPGSRTPLFSPIPFLTADADADALGEPMMDRMDGGDGAGLMSPLVLDSGGGVFHQQQMARRSPTPEPEEDAEMDDGEKKEMDKEAEENTDDKMDTDEPEAERDGTSADGETKPKAETATEPLSDTTNADSNGRDPGHEPYLGRVDELDAGPVDVANGNGHGEEGDEKPGLGERGAMTPHAMSDRPVPISSTTVIADTPREIAPLRRSVSQAEGEEKVGEESKGGEQSNVGQDSKVEESKVGEDSKVDEAALTSEGTEKTEAEAVE